MGGQIGFGVVGAGAIGIRGALMHLSQEDVQDRVRLAAVCDPVPGRAEAAAAKYGVAAHYTTYEALLGDPGVDAVTICSPIGLHYQQGLMAIEAGKHIHFNKTMTTTVDEATEIIARAKAARVQIVASPGMMMHAHNRRMRSLVLEGALGQLAWAISGTTAGSGTYHLNEEFRTGEDILTSVDPSWYFKKPGGGPQYDVTVYCLHILTGVLGPAQQVMALSGIAIPMREHLGNPIVTEMDDQTIMMLDFGGTTYAIVYATVAGGLTKGFFPNIYGTQGSIVGLQYGDQNLQVAGEYPKHVRGPHSKMAESHVFEDMMELVDLIQEGTTPMGTTDHARHVIDIIESAYRSAETGQTQSLRTTFTPLSLEDL
jgi:predicted dehydrogenase